MGPSLIDSSLVRHDKEGDLIGKVIQGGRPDKGMPAFPALSASQISDLVAYLHARIEVNTIATAANGPVGGYVLKRLLSGNPDAGKQYFYGEGRCANCHSPTKDLAGIGSKYSAVELESRFLFPPEDKTTATVSLPSGRTIKGKLIHVDEFYVAIIDDSGWYRSWSTKDVKVLLEDPLSVHLDLLGRYKNEDIHNVFAYLETLK